MKKLMLVVVAVAGFAAQADTLAYWPMTISGSMVKDATANGYHLSVWSAAVSRSAISSGTQDIGWADNLPPNPDALGAASASPNYITTCPGTVSGGYSGVLSTSNQALRRALAADRDFTVEGWIRPTSLFTDHNELLMYNSLGYRGGWTWNIYNTSAAGIYTIKMAIANTDGSYPTKDMAVTLSEGELLNKWNHIALVHVAETETVRSEWKFYMNGRLRGSLKDGYAITSVDFSGGSSIFISGCGSSTAQQLTGDMTSWRVSNVALAPKDFLCAETNETIAYWTMGNQGNSRAIYNSVSSSFDWSTRAASLGGVTLGLANDIGWSGNQPPNPDSLAYNAGPWLSDKMIQVDYGEKSGSVYQPSFSLWSAELASAMLPTNDFCIEGYYKATALPASSDLSHLFVYNSFGQLAGWTWNISGADASGNCGVYVLYVNEAYADASKNKQLSVDLGSVPSTEILNKWAHYALAFESGPNVWKFYFNGKLIGCAAARRYESVTNTQQYLQFFGCGSGRAQTPPGYLTTWRVSQSAEPSRLLCGCDLENSTLTWKGTVDSDWSSSSESKNWVDSEGNSVAWSDGYRAVFDGTGSSEVKFGSLLKMTELVVDSDTDITMTTKKACAISTCGIFTKRGTGTLWMKVDTANKGNINQSANHISIEEGTLRVSCSNVHYGLGRSDTQLGCEAVVHPGAKLWVDERNALGWELITQVSQNTLIVLTNGVFDLTTCAAEESEDFNIQQFGTLKLLGGTIVPPSEGHSSGCLQIRDRVVFGKNPSKTPYYFARDSVNGWDTLGWKFCTNTVFEVADITENANADVTFDCHLMAVKSWNDVADCSFCKTGAGKMVLQQAKENYQTANLCYPSGTSQVQAGELEIDAHYPAAFAVASGAYLSGTGTVSSVTLADGAGLRGTFAKRQGMTVTGNCTLGATGKVELTGAPAKLHSVTLLKVGGTITGEANLANWTLTVDGAAAPDSIALRVINQRLVAHNDSGFVFVIK